MKHFCLISRIRDNEEDFINSSERSEWMKQEDEEGKDPINWTESLRIPQEMKNYWTSIDFI